MFSSARALAAAGAAALALAAAAPAAQAEVRYVYDAWFSSGVAYETGETSESGKVTRRTAARFVVTGWFQDLRFVDGMLLTQRMASRTRLTQASSELHYVNSDIDPVDTADCVDDAPRLGMAGMLSPLRAYDPSAPPAAFGLTPFSMVTFDLNCDVGGTLLGIGAVSHRPGDLGPGHLRTELVVARGKLGDERITLPFERIHRSMRRCPGAFVESDLRSCVTVIRGSVVLFRTYRDVSSEEDDLLAPLVPQRPKVDRGARRGRARARCPRGCRYRIRIFETPRNGRGVLGRSLPMRAAAADAAAAAPQAGTAAAVVASRSGRLPAGRAARTISVAIPPSKRAALVEAGTALVAIELDPPKGRTTRATFLVPVNG